jgi:hypothetical protein
MSAMGELFYINMRETLREQSISMVNALGAMSSFRRLASHGASGGSLRKRRVMTDFLCPRREMVECIASTSACQTSADHDHASNSTNDDDDDATGNVTHADSDNDDNDDDDDTLRFLEDCGKVLAVKVAFELTVDDPQAFVDDPNSAPSIAQGIADQIEGVSFEDVEVELSVAARRLDSHASGNTTTTPSSTSGTVNVDATIQVQDEASVAVIQERVDSVDSDALTQAIVTALGGNISLTVASISASAAPPAGTPPGATPAPSAVPSTDSAKIATVSHCVAVLILRQFSLY